MLQVRMNSFPGVYLPRLGSCQAIGIAKLGILYARMTI
jgi:hypothetical protein